jgi:hypothetical protein
MLYSDWLYWRPKYCINNGIVKANLPYINLTSRVEKLLKQLALKAVYIWVVLAIFELEANGSKELSKCRYIDTPS